MSTEDDAPSGSPKQVFTDENIKKVHKIISDNRKVKLIEIPETLKISNERLGYIVNEYLDMLKLCSKRVPRYLTIDQKQQRIDDSKQCLELFNLLPHPAYSPDCATSDFFLFSNLKRMLAGKKFCADEKVIAETETYFEAKDKSYYKNGIEKLYDFYIRFIEGNYIK